MKVKILCFLTALFLALHVFPSALLTVYAEETPSRVEVMLEEMPLREKITQMMMVDFQEWGDTAENVTDFTEINDDVRRIVEDYRFGAVILFSNNVKETEQTLLLTQALQSAATKNGGIPLIITADQEGGIVSRLTWLGNCSARQYGAWRDLCRKRH